MCFLRLHKGEESLFVPKGRFRLSNSWRGGFRTLWMEGDRECCRSPGHSRGHGLSPRKEMASHIRPSMDS